LQELGPQVGAVIVKTYFGECRQCKTRRIGWRASRGLDDHTISTIHGIIADIVVVGMSGEYGLLQYQYKHQQHEAPDIPEIVSAELH